MGCERYVVPGLGELGGNENNAAVARGHEKIIVGSEWLMERENLVDPAATSCATRLAALEKRTPTSTANTRAEGGIVSANWHEAGRVPGLLLKMIECGALSYFKTSPGNVRLAPFWSDGRARDPVSADSRDEIEQVAVAFG